MTNLVSNDRMTAFGTPLMTGPAASPDLSQTVERYRSRVLELRYWLLGLFGAAIVIAIAATLLQTPNYRSTARIEISRVDSGAAAGPGTLDAPVEDRDRQYYETQYELLHSRFLANRVVEAENLLNDEVFLEAFGFSAGQSGLDRAAASLLLGAVDVEPVERSNLVDISFVTPAPGLSARLANAWAEQFLRANYDKRFGDTLLAREQLQQQLGEMRERLETSEANLISYANANGIVVVDRGEDGAGAGSTLLSAELDTLSSALAGATARRIAAESALRAGDDAASLAGTGALSTRLAEIRGQLANLSSTLGPENPKVKALQAQEESISRSLAAEDGRFGSARQSEYRRAMLEERALRDRFEAVKAAYLGQQGSGVQYGILLREVDTNRQIYDALLQRFKEIDVAGTGNNNMTQIEQALPNRSPYSPSLPLNLALAIVAAALISGLAVYAAEAMDSSIRDPEEMRSLLGLDLIGMIPQTNDADLLEEIADPHSELSEAYASAALSIRLGTAGDGQGSRSLMLTSTRPNEGKTISSIALALSFARIGEKVLLVDLDLRRTGLSKLLSVRGTHGTSALLGDPSTAPEIAALDDFGIDFLPSGPARKDRFVLLTAARMKAALTRLRPFDYDRIIFDGPPVLGLADAPELSRAIDAVVYVVQANAGSQRAVRRGLARMRGADARMLGGLVTQLDSRNDIYGYGGGYGFGYAYGEEEAA